MRKCIVYVSVAAVLLLSSAVVFADCSPSVMWQTSGTTAWTTDCAKVGIGTNDPYAKLEVSGGNKIGLDVTNGSIWLSNPTAPNSYSGPNYDRIGIGFRADVATITTEAAGTPGIQRPIQINPQGKSGIFLATSGNIGMGTTVPNDLLHLNAVENTNIRLTHSAAASASNAIMFYEGSALYGFVNQRGSAHATEPKQFNIGNNDPGGSVALWVNSERMRITSAGNIGIGTKTPGINGMSNTLTVQGANTRGMLELATGQGDADGVGAGQVGFYANANTSGNQQIAAIYSLTSGSTANHRGGMLTFWIKPDAGGLTEVMRLDRSGKLGIGTTAPSALLTVGTAGGTGNKLTVNGDVTVTGNLAAKYQDVAEWVPATESMLPGTVVVVDRGSENTVTPSSHRYDTRVAGVVSAQPGIILGVEGSSKAMIATTGRVRVRVDASRRPIEAGDLLVTSDKSGVAMPSEPIDVGGVKIHRPGTLIGKALEPLAGGEGEILVLLSMQ